MSFLSQIQLLQQSNMYSVTRKKFIFHRLEAIKDDGKMPAQYEDLLNAPWCDRGPGRSEGGVCLALSYLLLFYFILCVGSFACMCVCAARLCLVPLGNKHRVPWNWGHKQFWTSSQCRLAAEPFLQLCSLHTSPSCYHGMLLSWPHLTPVPPRGHTQRIINVLIWESSLQPMNSGTTLLLFSFIILCQHALENFMGTQ